MLRILVQEVAGQWAVVGSLASVEGVVPDTLRQLIVQQFASLSPEEQRVLEAASVVGLESPVAAIATGTALAEAEVEAQCAALVRRGQFLQAQGVEAWPDGTVTGQYRFRHVLYQQVVYEGVPAAQRIRLHRQIAARLEVGYGAQAAERAAERAMHFARGQVVAQAEGCFEQALALARRQHARSLELRAALRLSRLWQQQGQQAAAYALLAPVYHWFTEGLDTADLQEAKTVLDMWQV